MSSRGRKPVSSGPWISGCGHVDTLEIWTPTSRGRSGRGRSGHPHRRMILTPGRLRGTACRALRGHFGHPHGGSRAHRAPSQTIVHRREVHATALCVRQPLPEAREASPRAHHARRSAVDSASVFSSDPVRSRPVRSHAQRRLQRSAAARVCSTPAAPPAPDARRSPDGDGPLDRATQAIRRRCPASQIASGSSTTLTPPLQQDQGSELWRHHPRWLHRSRNARQPRAR